MKHSSVALSCPCSIYWWVFCFLLIICPVSAHFIGFSAFYSYVYCQLILLGFFFCFLLIIIFCQLIFLHLCKEPFHKNLLLIHQGFKLVSLFQTLVYNAPSLSTLPRTCTLFSAHLHSVCIRKAISLSFCLNSYSASHDNWCTQTLWNRIITAQCEGMGEVGSARYEPALLPPCPSIRVLCYSNCHEIHPLQQPGLAV